MSVKSRPNHPGAVQYLAKEGLLDEGSVDPVYQAKARMAQNYEHIRDSMS
jgi:hypothetical protein